jgi:hypothetical protein
MGRQSVPGRRLLKLRAFSKFSLPMPRIFLLSPPNCSGVKAQALLNGTSRGEMARRLRSTEGVPLGELASYLSSLYFRGKLAYARAFGATPNGLPGCHVITPHRGLVGADHTVTLPELQAMAAVEIDLAEPRYVVPLVKSAVLLHQQCEECEMVLLGSVATGKYVECLQPIFGETLLFPADFVGRGDMSRGGLMLRCAAAGTELNYIPVQDAIRKGKRPPKLEKR